jgi:hypothetical protein
MSWASAARVQVAVAREQAKVAGMADEEGTAAWYDQYKAEQHGHVVYDPPAAVNRVVVEGPGGTEGWAQMAHTADPEDQGPLGYPRAGWSWQGDDPAGLVYAPTPPLESERIAAKRSWMAPSSVAGLCRRLWAWASSQPAGAQQVAAKVVVGFAAVLVWSYYVTLMIVVVPFFWLAFVFGAFFNHGRRRTLVAQARHREQLDALRRVGS